MPVKLSLEVTSEKFPDIRLAQAFWTKVGKEMEKGVLVNLNTSTQADGAPIKANPSGYASAKRKRGGGTKPLIAFKKRFVRSGGGSWKITRFLGGQGGIEFGPATAELKRLILETSRKGYNGYLGLNAKAAKAVEELLGMEVKRILDGPKKKVKRKT